MFFKKDASFEVFVNIQLGDLLNLCIDIKGLVEFIVVDDDKL